MTTRCRMPEAARRVNAIQVQALDAKRVLADDQAPVTRRRKAHRLLLAARTAYRALPDAAITAYIGWLYSLYDGQTEAEVPSPQRAHYRAVQQEAARHRQALLARRRP